MEFSDAALNGTKALGPALKVTGDNRSEAFQAFQEKAKGERIILRHAQITNIVGKSKGEKRQWIAKIIGYQAITDFRNAVQSARNALQSDPNYGTAKQLAQTAQSELFRLAQRVIATWEDLFAKVNELIAPYALGFTVADKASYESAVKALVEKVSDPDSAKKKTRLDQLKIECEAFAAKAEMLLHAKDAFGGAYDTLAGDREAVTQLNIGKFLGAGKQVIEGGHYTAQSCPFCLSPYDL